jgi:two-component system chemotaxis response regulator CheB
MPNERPNTRYGSYAIPLLIEEMVALGADASKIQAKIYGGANVISIGTAGDGIGKRNIDLAEKFLSEKRIQIVERNVGGEAARTIKMNSRTFEIIHKTSDTDRSEASKAETPAAERKPRVVDVSGFKTLSVAKNVRVLIVDDSATVRTLFQNIFAKAGLEVVGTAADPYQAREMIMKTKPDVMTLDIEMPKMSGVMFLEKIMKHHPIPTVMVSSLAATGDAALKSLELGAVEFVHKPSQFDPAILKDLASTLIEKVRAAASVNLVKLMKDRPKAVDTTSDVKAHSPIKKAAELKVIVVGGNAGSPPALEALIAGLAADTPPVIVSCATIANFAESFVAKLKSKAKVSVQVGVNGGLLSLGNVYIIPSEHHGRVEKSGTTAVLRLEKGHPVNSQMPSANVLFKSAASSYGAGVYGILLGGFGIDGVDGMTEVQKSGGFTVAQNPEEAQFPYGPQKAIEIGVVDEILAVNAISGHLMDYRNKNLY